MQEATIPLGLERRREDYQLITGRARFVDDVRLPEERPAMLHMTLVRSPYAHAENHKHQAKCSYGYSRCRSYFDGSRPGK